MRRYVSVVAMCLVVAVAGCGSEEYAGEASVCGDGEPMEFQAVQACVWGGELLIETGFQCPEGMPHEHELGDYRVCAEEERLPEGFEEELRRQFEGEEACGATRCLSNEACVEDRCRPLDPCRDVVCGDGGQCVDGACVSPEEMCGEVVCEEGEVCWFGRCVTEQAAMCLELENRAADEARNINHCSSDAECEYAVHPGECSGWAVSSNADHASFDAILEMMSSQCTCREFGSCNNGCTGPLEVGCVESRCQIIWN